MLKKRISLVRICVFLLALAPMMIESRSSPGWLIGEPEIPTRYDQ